MPHRFGRTEKREGERERGRGMEREVVRGGGRRRQSL